MYHKCNISNHEEEGGTSTIRKGFQNGSFDSYMYTVSENSDNAICTLALAVVFCKENPYMSYFLLD